MVEPLVTYLQDHLAGARFAIDLLQDLREQSSDPTIAHFASAVLPEVDADRVVLQTFLDQIGGDAGIFKEAAGWLAQKASRFKLSLNDPIGRFEAVEMLSLGVLGKQALWSALMVLRKSDERLQTLGLEKLIARATSQHAQLEQMRLQLAMIALQKNHN